jgi:hypothetical protein
MQTAAQYRQYAQECMDSARIATSERREYSSLNSLNCGLRPQYKWTSGLTAKHPGRRVTAHRKNNRK